MMLKKVTSIVLCFALLFSLCSYFSVGASAQDSIAACDGNCGYSPTILIHGIGQSTVRILDESGEFKRDKNGEYVNAWPISVDTRYLVSLLIRPVIKTLFTQRNYVSPVLDEAADVIFSSNMCDNEGKPYADLNVVKYEKSLADCTAEEKAKIYGTLPMHDYAQIAGEDHLFFFAYNSFGNAMDIADEFIAFIEMVKQSTGHDKVSIVPISLGGTIMNSIMECHMSEIEDSIDRVVYIIPAADGSRIIGDLYNGKFSTDDESLYLTLWPSLLKGYAGYLVNIALRLLKNEIVIDVIDSLLATLTQKVLINCTNMWALVPSGDYPALREKYLCDGEHDVLREQTDAYYNAQLNRDDNINYLKSRGVEFFNIVDYDFPLYALVPSYKDCNADGVIHVHSTSLGCTSVPVGETLPEDYAPVNPKCTDPTHNHISPSRTLDASTCLLPETTWYMRNQNHEGSGRNHVIINLATKILVGQISSIYDNDNYPQFIDGRESRELRRLLNFTENEADLSALSEEQRARLSEALEQGHFVVDNNTTSQEEFYLAADNLKQVLAECLLITPPKAPSKIEIAFTKLCKSLSEKLYNKYGNKGFFER